MISSHPGWTARSEGGRVDEGEEAEEGAHSEQLKKGEGGRGRQGWS